MSNSAFPPYLRLVDSTALEVEPELSAHDRDRALLGFVDMSRATGETIEAVLARVRPTWIFDLRPVPYFDIGRMDRRRAFELFRESRASYRDVAGRLGIASHDDASLNSGAVASFLNKLLAERPFPPAVVVLVDGQDTLGHAMKVLPPALRGSDAAWCPVTLDLDMRGEHPDLVMRSASGEVVFAQIKCATEDKQWGRP